MLVQHNRVPWNGVGVGVGLYMHEMISRVLVEHYARYSAVQQADRLIKSLDALNIHRPAPLPLIAAADFITRLLPGSC